MLCVPLMKRLRWSLTAIKILPALTNGPKAPGRRCDSFVYSQKRYRLGPSSSLIPLPELQRAIVYTDPKNRPRIFRCEVGRFHFISFGVSGFGSLRIPLSRYLGLIAFSSARGGGVYRCEAAAANILYRSQTAHFHYLSESKPQFQLC